MDLQDTTYTLIERAARRGADIMDARPGQSGARSNIALAATRPGDHLDPAIDETTGLPPSPVVATFKAGDVAGVNPVDG